MTSWDPMWSETGEDETGDAARWRTPPEVFQPLHREFRFGLDVAAVSDSALIPHWLGPDHPSPVRRDAFEADWTAARGHGPAAWMNPPYGRGMGRWMVLAARWGRVMPVVVLILARTDLPWWDEVVMATAAEIRFVRGRVRFLDGVTGERAGGAPAPSVVLVWRPDRYALGPPVVSVQYQERRPRERRPANVSGGPRGGSGAAPG